MILCPKKFRPKKKFCQKKIRPKNLGQKHIVEAEARAGLVGVTNKAGLKLFSKDFKYFFNANKTILLNFINLYEILLIPSNLLKLGLSVQF